MTELSGKSYDELVWLVLEGTASDADRSELAARLKASGAVRRNYVDDMYFHAVLRGRLTGAAGLAKPRSAAPNSSLAQVRTRERHWRRASMVAGVLLGTCALLAGVAVSVSGIAGWSGKGAPSLEGEASLSSATGPASAAVASQTQTGASASPEKGQPSKETGKKEMMEMKSLTKALSAAGMVLAASASSAGDEYQFYPEGYNPSGTSSSVAHSSGVALDTGSVRVPAEPDALVARYRTFGTSNTSKLNTSKYQGFRIIFR